MTSESGLLIYIRHTSLEAGKRWISTFLNNLFVTYAEAGFVALTGSYRGGIVQPALTQGPDDSLQIVATKDHLPWQDSIGFGRAAFRFFDAEVECIPPDEHAPGEMLVISKQGEAIIDLDEV